MIRSILVVSVMFAGSAEAQVLRKIELKKLTTDDLRQLKANALRGERRSMTIMGIALVEGYGVSRDVPSGVNWLERAAKTDDVAQEYLGSMLRSGVYVPQDITRARVLFAKAAGQGNRRAQFNYASLCFNGQGGTQDIDVAAKYFEIAARQGNPEAQHMVARLYQYGHGVAKDYEQAIRWYDTAAMQNYVPSMFALGIAYAEGDLGVKDGEKARQYLERAANLGDWASALRMANMYLNGEQVPRNEAEAYKWSAIARELSGVEVSPTPKSLEGQLKPLELASAKQEISDWIAMRAK